MKPINADNPGCDPISSNCVIWQGPDLDCIGLCKGDSVSQVVEKLAKELCAVLTSLNIDSYDISCLAIGGCKPETFQALIQIIIDKICALEGIHQDDATGTGTGTIPATGGTTSDIPIKTPILAGTKPYPDVVVRAPETFWYKNALGDTITDFQLVDLAYTAANMIDKQVGQINTINSTLRNHEGRIDNLEKIPAPELVLPNVIPVCVLPPDLVPLDVFTKALEEQFCELESATGDPTAIYNALVLQCLGLGQSPQLQNGGSNMNAIPGWRDDVTSFADGFANMWYTICDMRDAVRSLQSVVSITDCDQLNIAVSGVLTNPGNLVLYFSGTIPSGYQEADPGTTLITITDAAGNSMSINVPVTANLNDASGYNVALTATPINQDSDLSIVVPLNYVDGANQCAKTVVEVVVATGNCPVVQLIPAQTTIAWNYTYLGTDASLDIILFAEDGVTQLQNQVNVTVGPGAFSGSFSGLTPGIQYKVQLKITPSGAPQATECPFSGVVTLANACLPVDALNGSLIIT
jgi:hypothetical protein